MNWLTSRAGIIVVVSILSMSLLGVAIAYPPTVVSSTAQQRVSMDSRLITANTKFGFKLFSLLNGENRNVFISPTSIAIALAMTYNGASHQTQTAMAKTLELQGMSLPEINQANQALKEMLENPDPDIQLSVANSLWAKQGIPFKAGFLQRNQQFYQAKVTNLDFAAPSSPDVINHWVQQETHGKIAQIVDQLKPQQVLLLINAIYFKGHWTHKFDKTQTALKPFYQLDGTPKQQPTMSQNGEYRYYENEQFQAVSLPYGKERLSLYIFLPKQSYSLKAFSQQLNAENWEQWINQLRKRQGFIQIPKFKLDYSVELSDPLKALGMDIAFDPTRANFTQMSSVPVNIDQVKHKTFVEVNEEGTEAAAVTSVGIMKTSAVRAPELPFRMIVDRPFFCAIRDNQTGTVLFMGSIVEPK